MPNQKTKTNKFYAAEGKGKRFGSRRWKLDIDYFHKLNPKERIFLEKFLQETVLGNFNHAGTKLYTSKKDQRALWRENNSSNQCITSLADSFGKIRTSRLNCSDEVFIEQLINEKLQSLTSEDGVLELLDKLSDLGDYT